MDYREFVSWWSTDELPACDVGMSLLKIVLDDVGQDVFFLNWRRHEVYEELDPTFSDHPSWVGFVDHHDSCDNCNEL